MGSNYLFCQLKEEYFITKTGKLAFSFSKSHLKEFISSFLHELLKYAFSKLILLYNWCHKSHIWKPFFLHELIEYVLPRDMFVQTWHHKSWWLCLLFLIFPETSNIKISNNFYQHCVNCMISILKSCLIPTFFRCQLVGGSNHGGGSSGQQHGGQNGQLGREGHHGSRQKPSNSR